MKSVHWPVQAVSRFVVVVVILTTAAASARQPRHPHDQLSCADCHRWSSTASQDAGASTRPPGDIKNTACRSCHRGPASGHGSGHRFHAAGGRDCTKCHGFHDTKLLQAGGKVFSYDFGDRTLRAHCASCHQGIGSEIDLDEAHRRAAASVYHIDAELLRESSPSEACLICHDATKTPPEPDQTDPTPIQFVTHATHPYGFMVIPGSGSGARKILDRLHPDLVLPGGRLECQTCHQLTSGTVDLLPPRDNPYALCLGCHDLEVPAPRQNVEVASSD